MYLVPGFAFMLLSTAQGLYIDTSYPFEDGTLGVSQVFPGDIWDAPPLITTVYYPNQTDNDPEEYAGLMFIGGFYGLMPGQIYEDLLELVASKGYVVIAPWPLDNPSVESLVETLEWLAMNWDSWVPVKMSWSHLSLSCHSAGCDNIVDLIKEHEEYEFKGAINMEPSSFYMDSPMPGAVPGLMLGSELSDGHCNFEGMDFRAFMDYWTCPKTLIEAGDFGHCDLLTEFFWHSCVSGEICPVGPEERLPEYRTFVQGLIVSFMNFYAQGSASYEKYFTDPDQMPLALTEFRHETAC